MIKISSSTLSCDGFQDIDFKKTWKYMQSIGIKYIELNMWHSDNLTPWKVADIKVKCKANGLTPIAVYGNGFSCSIDKEICHKMRMIDVAVELGCRRIVSTGSSDPDYTIENIICALKELVSYAEEKNVLICLENHVNNTLAKIDDYQRIFDAVSSPNIGLCVDTGHFEAAGEKLDAVVKQFSRKINHIHVKENKGFGTKNFTFFGQGETDNRKIVKDLINLGYSGYVNIELSPEIGGKRSGDTPPLDELKKAYEIFIYFEDASTQGEM